MRRLRLFAALSVLTSAAFFPALFPAPASAALPTLYTLGEYNAALNAAQSAVDGATAQVAIAQANLDASAVYHETSTVTGQVNVVVNGTFDNASAWSNIGMGDNSTILNSNIARVYNGVLIGSYTYGFILQTGTFPSPTRQVTFSYDMSNNNFNDGARPQADGYRVEFRTYNAAGQRLNYYDTGNRADTFDWRNFSTTYTLSDDAVRWDIGFRLIDNGYWNGNFAGSVDNVSLITAATTTTPAYTSYDPELVTILNQKRSALTAAQAALAAIPPLAINAPSQLVASMDTSTVTLSWAAPTTNLIPERYAISWTDGTGGWGIATGNAGDANALNTSITIDKSIIGSTGGWDKNYTFTIRSDHDSGSMYSAWSNQATLFITNPTPTPEPSTSPVPSPEPSPTQTPEAPTPSPSPTNTSPSPEPSTTPSPEPSVTPSPEPSVPPAPTPQPSPEPSPEPTPVPSPTPTPTVPEAVLPEPTPLPSPQPVPSPEPGPAPSVEPTPQPVPVEPALPVVPQPEPSNPTPEPEPTPVSPEPTPTDPTDTETPSEPIEVPPVAVEPEEPSVEPEEPEEPSTPEEPEPTPPTLEPEPENPSTEPLEPPIIEEEEPSTEVEEVASAVEDVLSDGRLSAADAENIMEALNADGEVTAEEVSALSEALSEDGKLTTAEKELVAEALIESVAPGETLTKEQIQDAGIEYKDLPEETPVEVRQDENGNEVIITADVAAALVLLENPSELIGAVFSDPGEALQALGSIGADMSTEEREEATDMVVATVVAAGAAMNAVGAAAGAAGGSTGGSTGGGGASGQSGYRRKP